MNDFYVLRDFQQAGASCSAVISFNAAHAIFEGHFPAQPVVPGVCSMRIIRDLLGKALGRQIVLQGAAQVKFLRLLTPADAPEVSLSWAEAEGSEIKATATMKIGGEAVLKMSAVYAT